MEPNTWYYTFSTSAQVMAALVGLFAVFVVYKIQEVGHLITAARLALNKILPYFAANTEGYEPLSSKGLTQMSDQKVCEVFKELLTLRLQGKTAVDYISSDGSISYGLDEATEDYFSKLVNSKIDILNQLVAVLVLSLLSIVISLTALVFTNYLISVPFFTIAALAFFLYTLWKIGRTIHKIALK